MHCIHCLWYTHDPHRTQNGSIKISLNHKKILLTSGIVPSAIIITLLVVLSPAFNGSTLNVITNVINNDGGTMNATSFKIHVSGTEVRPTTLMGSGEGISVSLQPGNYHVTEDSVPKYSQFLSEGCSGTIGARETRTCIITNDDMPSTISSSGNLEKKTVLWYGSKLQSAAGRDVLADHLEKSDSFVVEERFLPIANLGHAELVVLNSPDWGYRYSAEEIIVLKTYVNNGGRLILATDTDYWHCKPTTTCGMEIARNFGFGFGDDIDGIAVPAAGAQFHAIWTTPNLIRDTRIAFDGIITEIVDKTDVQVLGVVQSGVSQLPNQVSGSDRAAIVLNENPAFQGGKVLGLGNNVLIGTNGDYRMLDNIINFMLS